MRQPTIGSFTIDERRLPRVAAVDAGVLMRALEPGRKNDDHAPACRAFWTAMLKDPKRSIIVPAPSMAEYLRGEPETRWPSAEQVYVVPFDGECAARLASAMPEEVRKVELKAFKKKFGATAPGAFIKYDAMIAVCAKRWGAQVLVSLDTDVQARLSRLVPIPCFLPSYYYGEQVEAVPAPPESPGSPPEVEG